MIIGKKIDFCARVPTVARLTRVTQSVHVDSQESSVIESKGVCEKVRRTESAKVRIFQSRLRDLWKTKRVTTPRVGSLEKRRIRGNPYRSGSKARKRDFNAGRLHEGKRVKQFDSIGREKNLGVADREAGGFANVTFGWGVRWKYRSAR